MWPKTYGRPAWRRQNDRRRVKVGRALDVVTRDRRFFTAAVEAGVVPTSTASMVQPWLWLPCANELKHFG